MAPFAAKIHYEGGSGEIRVRHGGVELDQGDVTILMHLNWLRAQAPCA